MPDPAKSRGLVLDTSVWINLLATEALEPILQALGIHCCVPEQVLLEIKRHPVTNEQLVPEAHPLLSLSPMVSVEALQGSELATFLELVSAPAPDAVGDGEAAAIAVAMSRSLDLVIDDKKARRILRERFGQVSTYWTVDLLQTLAVRDALGEQSVKVCWDKAVKFGRMHIPR